MSIENHPNIHTIELMLKIHEAIQATLRGNGKMLPLEDRLHIAKAAAESIEELVDDKVKDK